MFLGLMAVHSMALSQAIVRGPYLQMATPDSITVKWRTDQLTDSAVRYGLMPNNLNQNDSSVGQTTEHEVLIGPLQPDTRYYYSVGTSSDELAGGDASHTFVTSPADGVDKATRIWVTGDAGTADANAAAVRDAYKDLTGTRPTDLWLTLGDIAYSHGTDAQYQAALFDMYPELLRQTPIWPVFGNHDGGSADSGTQTGPYYEIFSLPTAAEAGGVASATEAYYSFDYGIIHFISLDSFDSDRSAGGSMIPWLINDLTANDKQWTIAFWHHPPYSKGSHNSNNEIELVEMRENAVAVLESFGVDLVLTGHSHSYERTYLLDGHYGSSNTLDSDMILDSGRGREDERGAYHKPGIAGTPREGAVYAVAGSSGKITSGPLNHPAMYISLLDYGSMVLDVSGNRLEAKFIDRSAVVQDYFTITKGDDIFSPTVVLIEPAGESTLNVLYSEPMDQASAAEINNYDINGLNISLASLQPDQRTVALTTAPMLPDMTYTLTINLAEDLAGNPVAADTQKTFTVPEQLITLSFQQGVSPTAAYSGARDTILDEDQSNINSGQAEILLVDGNDPRETGLDKSTLIHWNIEEIPTGVAVQSARIEIDVSNSSQDLYSFYQMKRDWQETEATWNQYANGVPWATPGAAGAADRGEAVLGTALATGTGMQTVELNEAGVALVQSWIDGTAPNYGLILADSQSSDGLDFASADGPSAVTRPRLVIDYYNAPVQDDSDGDGVADILDNCTDVPNGPLSPDAGGHSQRDTDSDGYGNVCDPDLNNDGLVTVSDFLILRTRLNTADQDADLDGDGFVTVSDFLILRQYLNNPPGPSGVAP